MKYRNLGRHATDYTGILHVEVGTGQHYMKTSYNT